MKYTIYRCFQAIGPTFSHFEPFLPFLLIFACLLPYKSTRGHGKLRLSRWNFRQNWQKWLNLFQTFFMSPKFMQKCSKLYGFSLKTSAKQRFLFSLLLKRKCINQEKLNVKTLLRPYIKRTHQSYQLLLGHLGMLWTQTEGVRLGI